MTTPHDAAVAAVAEALHVQECGRDCVASRTVMQARETPVLPTGGLSPAFVEWMLGFPAGHVSDSGVSRMAQLRILGNSVQVQCAEAIGWELAQALKAEPQASTSA